MSSSLTPRTSQRAAPVIETERLVLRPHAATDFDGVYTLWADPLVMRHILGRPSTREESWSRLLRYAGHWSLLGFGFWAMQEKGGASFVGEVGLAEFQRQIEPTFGGDPEAGWVLMPSAHGKGYATEAMRAVLAWSDRELRANTGCIISPENKASIRVAEKLGFSEWQRSTYNAEQLIMFRRPAP
jgi:RimJ/RimL family protein N-acetyltransferase